MRSPAAAEYASGRLLFVSDRTLMAQAFDADRLELTGEDFPVAPNVRLLVEGTALAVFSAYANGVLAYAAEAGGRRLVWRNREGDVAHYRDVRLSPDGRWVLYVVDERERGIVLVEGFR